MKLCRFLPPGDAGLDHGAPFLLVAVLASCLGCAGVARPGPETRGETIPGRRARIPVTGEERAELTSFDELMLSFVEDERIPGAALALVKDGRLVLARGYGWADREERAPVRPTSLFRIASVSKPITAVAVLQLAERGKLRLDDRVLPLLGLQAHLAADDAQPDPRIAEITVRQLLQHRAGFDRGVSFDPMFRSVEIARELDVDPPAGPRHVIRYMLGRRLDFDPGSRYAYSNLGFCMLGRIIEQASGKPYDDFVKESVLAPIGIRSMRIGATLPAGRAPREVRYYDIQEDIQEDIPEDIQEGVPDGTRRKARAVVGDDIGAEVPFPYGGWYLEAMDAHGAWIASVVDLARFATAFDGPGDGPLLKSESIRTMFARPPGAAGLDPKGEDKDVYYGCGWMVRDKGGGKINTWHTGSLDGTAALLVRRHDGLSWAVLFNTRSGTGPDRKHLGRAIDPRIHEAAAAVESWPEDLDLFDQYR